MKCPIHGDNCPGDDGGFFIDGNHPDDMFSVGDRKMRGVVRMLNGEKRFGFIQTDVGDFFFHASAFNGHWDDLEADFRSHKKIEVEFDRDNGPKGPRASNVSRLDWPNQAAREYNG